MKKVCTLLLVFVLMLNLSVYTNKTKGYVAWFGAGLSVFNPSQATQPDDIAITRDNFTSDCPSIAWDKTGNAHLLFWSDATGNREIFYVRWNGYTWVNAQGALWNRAAYNANVSQNAGISHYGTIKLDSNGRPHILWMDSTVNSHGLFYVRWDGANWVTSSGAIYNGTNANIGISGGAGALSGFKQYAFALDSNNYPHVVFSDTISGNQEIYYIKLEGIVWMTANGTVFDNVTGSNALVSNTPLNNSAIPDISIGPNNMAHIVWRETIVNTPTQILASVNYLYLDNPIWKNRQGSAYDPISRNAQITLETEYATFPKIVVDKFNTTHIMFSHQDSWIPPWSVTMKFDIHYIRSKGGSFGWTNAKGDDFDLALMNSNVSQNAGYSFSYSPTPMAIDSKGYPHIVWEDNSYKSLTAASLDIYYVHWNGTAWVNDGGFAWDPMSGNACIVNNTLESSCADIALDDKDSPMIVWEDDSYEGSDTEIMYIQLKSYDMGYVFKKTVAINDSIAYNDNGKTVYVGDELHYNMDLDINPNPHDPYAPYVFDKIPDGTTYKVGSASPTLDLAYSNDNGLTWTAGEPPDEAPAGTRLRWGPLWRNWVGMADSRYNGNLLQSQQPFDINVSRVQGFGRAFMCPSMTTDSKGMPNIVTWVPFGSATEQKVFFFRWDGSNWVSMDGQTYVPSAGSNNAACVNPGPSTSAYPMMVLDVFDNPHIVWYERFNQAPIRNGVYYVRWQPGMGWVCADGSKYNSLLGNARLTNYSCSSTTYPPSICNLEVDSKNNVHIVFERTVGPGRNAVCYTYWDGSAWMTANGTPFDKNTPNADIFPATAGIYATVPRIAIDRNDRPHIIWTENSSRELYYIYKNANNWICRTGNQFDPLNPLATNARLSRTAGNTGWGEICIGTDDSIHVAWEETISPGNSDIFYVKSDNGTWWNNADGNQWNPLTLNANVTNDAGLSRYIFIGDKMALDYMNRPHIVWEDSFSSLPPLGNEVCYARWNGNEWVNVRGEMHSQFLDNFNVSQSNARQSSCPSVSIDLKERPYVTWEEGNDTTPEPCQTYFLRRPEYNFKFSVRIDDPFDYKNTPITNEGWICNTGEGNCPDVTKSNKVINPVYRPMPEIVVYNTPEDSQLCPGDPIKINLTIKNDGDLAATNVVCRYYLPRELTVVNTTPTMVSSQGVLVANLGTMNPGDGIVYKIELKLGKNIQVINDLRLFTEAVVTYSEKSEPVKKLASININNCQERKPLLLYTEWTGINIKTSEGEAGKEIVVKFRPEWFDHGVSPYSFIVDWGDGTSEKFFDKTGDKLLESKHTYSISGVYNFWIKVDDAVARSYKVTRKLNIK